MDRQAGGWMDRQAGGWKDKWLDGMTEGWRDRQIDKRTHGRTHGWKNELINAPGVFFPQFHHIVKTLVELLFESAVLEVSNPVGGVFRFVPERAVRPHLQSAASSSCIITVRNSSVRCIFHRLRDCTFIG